MKISRRTEIVLAAVMFFLPWVPKVLFGLPWLMLQNFTDGVFYLGYAMDFRELVDRVGLNYYAVRFSGILPDALAFSLLGPEWGLVLVRYGLAGACCVALFVCFQRRYSTAAGVLAAVAWALNPAAIRFLQTAYVDVTAASFLCIGLAVSCLRGVGAFGAGCAGVLFSLAFWGHLHAAVALVFAGPLVLVALWEQGTKRALVLLGWISAGFLIPTLGAAVFYFLQFGLWDLTSPTRELLKTLREGHIPAPRLEWLEVVRQCPFWLASIPLGAALCFVPKPDRFVFAAFFSFAGYIAFLLWGDMFNGGYSLSLFYYFSFALPGLVFVVASQIGCLAREGLSWGMAFVLGGMLFLPVLVIGWNLPGGAWAAGCTVVLLAGCAIAWGGGHRFRIGGLSLGVGISLILVAIAGTSRLALGNYWKGDDLPVLTAAKELAVILPKYHSRPAPVVFWFDDKDGSPLRMIQSFYLHEFTKWKDAAGARVPFPSQANPQAVLEWQMGEGSLVVLAESEEERRRALESLRNREGASVSKFQIPAANPIAYGALVSFPDPFFPKASSLLERVALHRKTRRSSEDGLAFETGPRKWNHDILVPLPQLLSGQAVRVRLQVLGGAIVVDVEESDGKSFSQTVVSKSDVPASILLFPPESESAMRLRIRNFSPHGVRSKLRIDDISVVESPLDAQ